MENIVINCVLLRNVDRHILFNGLCRVFYFTYILWKLELGTKSTCLLQYPNITQCFSLHWASLIVILVDLLDIIYLRDLDIIIYFYMNEPLRSYSTS